MKPLFHVITLNGYSERQENVSNAFKRAGLDFRFHFFERDSKNPVRGCYTSHASLYQDLLLSGEKWIFVCEDNIVLPREVPSGYFEELFRFMENNEFDVIHLAAFFWPQHRCYSVKEYPNVFRMAGGKRGMQGASCYIISREACARIPFSYTKTAIDYAFLDFGRRYIYRPLLFHHARVKSSIFTNIDRVRNAWFHPWIYKSCEQFFFSGVLLEVLLLVVVVLLILLILCAFLFCRGLYRACAWGLSCTQS